MSDYEWTVHPATCSVCGMPTTTRELPTPDDVTCEDCGVGGQ